MATSKPLTFAAVASKPAVPQPLKKVTQLVVQAALPKVAAENIKHYCHRCAYYTNSHFTDNKPVKCHGCNVCLCGCHTMWAIVWCSYCNCKSDD
jgi:MinD superfamily P-loop ATPase